jgi:hypothetical protein
MSRRLALLLLLCPLAALSAQARLVPAELVAHRINRISVENPRRTFYRRLTVVGRDDHNELFTLYENSSPGARERLECSVYLDDTIAELIVELVPEMGRPESFSLEVKAGGYHIGVLGAPLPLAPPYRRLEDARQLEPGDLYVDSGTLQPEDLSRLLSAGIHCLSSRAWPVRPETGRYQGRLIYLGFSGPGEIGRALAAEQKELALFKASYRRLVTGNVFYGIPSRDPDPRFALAKPEDIAATLARDSFKWRLTRPQILVLAVFYTACLLMLLLVRRRTLLLGLLAALGLGFFPAILQVPAREHLLVIDLNPASLDDPDLTFITGQAGGAGEGTRSSYQALAFSEAAPRLAYRQLYSIRKRFPLTPLAGAVLIRINQIPLIRSEGEDLFLEYTTNPLKIWTVHGPQ